MTPDLHLKLCPYCHNKFLAKNVRRSFCMRNDCKLAAQRDRIKLTQAITEANGKPFTEELRKQAEDERPYSEET